MNGRGPAKESVQAAALTALIVAVLGTLILGLPSLPPETVPDPRVQDWHEASPRHPSPQFQRGEVRESPQVRQERLPAPVAGNRPKEPTRPWPRVDYREVRAYYSSVPFDNLRDSRPGQVEDKVLNEDQTRRLVAALNARAAPYRTIEFWAPQHAFVFYDASGQQVAEVDIGFSFFVVGRPGHPPGYPDIVALAELTEELGLPLGSYQNADEFRAHFNETQQRWKRQE